MYKTKWGLKLMDSISKKYSKLIIYSISILSLVGILFILIQTVNFLEITKKILESLPSIYKLIIFVGLAIAVFLVFVPNERKMPVVGFLGMIVIVYFLMGGVYQIFAKPESAPPLGLVLPIPVKVPGIFGIPFSYWIISIFIIALIHEFSHGLIARKYNIKVKSSGFALVGANLKIISVIIIVISILNKLRISKYNLSGFITFNFMDFSSPDVWILIGAILLVVSLIKQLWIPIIPAAFVEPDEKELKKRAQSEQLNVFAAGPLANIALATSLIVISFLTLVPLSNAISEPNGVAIVGYVKGSQTFPAELNGIKLGETIKEIDGMPTPYRENLSAMLKNKKPGDKVVIKTNSSTYELALARNPENSSQAFLGASLAQSTKINDKIKIRYSKVLPFLFW
ncbi:site-2 protease family protein, partial [Candidatus Woesearchaeota archaeon]|nr:site-2 protease family protein [Candidatus Woesearchaeota archaeon]